jgi:spermidine synthase
MIWFSLFFFISGLCSIVYELVWLRLAMAKFGVTTALVSIVLSVFMAGLGAGSWIAGAAVRRYGERIRTSPLRLYGFVELLIGISAVIVPLELDWGSRLLETMAGAVPVSSASYYLLSGLWLALTLVPWCACMGATIPIAMFAIRGYRRDESQRSFSLLYLANVVGAVGGACLAPVLIELYGFHGTLRTGAVLNGLIFVSAMLVAIRLQSNRAASEAPMLHADVSAASRASANPAGRDRSTLLLLFTTGLATMGAEVVWIRLYTFYIGPVVYSFAAILASYLVATFIGSKIYRNWSRREPERDMRLLWISLGFFGLLPLLTADNRLPLNADLRVLFGVAPFAGIIGFLTPMLVDRWSDGDPDRAGRAYAVNVLGCIVGPLLAGFVLLPLLGERMSMLALALPWFGMAVLGNRKDEPARRTAFSAAVLIAAITLFYFSRDYEALYGDGVTRRDSTATVIATGEGMKKLLLVNGIGMTVLSPVTKMMAHFTLTHLQQPPRNALIICFGMGTTFRSAMSWGIPVTVAELVPSVPKMFTYYHPDGGSLLASPRAHMVVDDGRRFLDRSAERFDAVIIDPPPPINAAGSSLLYSREFYELVKAHLSPGGILQQWLFTGDDADKASATRAMTEVFPYVRVYASMFGNTGYHLLASTQPIPERTASELTSRMPPAAIADMLEWGPAKTPQQQFELMLKQEISPQQLIALSPQTPALDDDHPINEYDGLRRMFARRVEAAAPGR